MNHTLTALLILLLSMKVYSHECVILLHGLARSDSSMKKLETSLQKEGYQTVNYSYPSRKYEINKLASDAIPAALTQCSDATKVSFVTHSMGGILIRQYLSHKKIENLNHVVMLGPPNNGSEVIDKIGNFPGFKAINGPAGLQLGTGPMSIPSTLGAAEFSLGIIAGTKTINLILSAMLPAPNDGKVSVESTKLVGMKDHITMPVTHPFMMKNKKVIAQVLYFLKHSKFKKRHSN